MNSSQIGAALAIAASVWLAMKLWRALRPSVLKIVTVIDGDTCVGVDARGTRRKLRIYGVDAPETGQPLAKEAKEALCKLVLNRWVSVRWRGKDRYRRFVVSLRHERQDAAAMLLKGGLAFPARTAGLLSLYALPARLSYVGVWGRAARPHESWRRRYRLAGWMAWRLQRRRRVKSPKPR